jgi:hypothetical protein
MTVYAKLVIIMGVRKINFAISENMSVKNMTFPHTMQDNILTSPDKKNTIRLVVS